MKLSELHEHFEDVPDIHPRVSSTHERIDQYQYKVRLYRMLLQRAQTFFYDHAYYQYHEAPDHRTYETRTEARKVGANFGVDDPTVTTVINITIESSRREQVRKKVRSGKSVYDNTLLYIPITPSNAKFRQKLSELATKAVEWEAAIIRAKASVQRLTRQYQKEANR